MLFSSTKVKSTSELRLQEYAEVSTMTSIHIQMIFSSNQENGFLHIILTSCLTYIWLYISLVIVFLTSLYRIFRTATKSDCTRHDCIYHPNPGISPCTYVLASLVSCAAPRQTIRIAMCICFWYN